MGHQSVVSAKCLPYVTGSSCPMTLCGSKSLFQESDDLGFLPLYKR